MKRQTGIIIAAGAVIVVTLLLVIGAVFRPDRWIPRGDRGGRSSDHPPSDAPPATEDPGAEVESGAVRAGQAAQREGFDLASDLPSCGSRKDLFTALPLKAGDFSHITPLGLLSPTAHTMPTPHLYFNVRLSNPRNQNALPVEVPAFAPGDMMIREIAFTDARNRDDFDDSDVKFSVCRDVVGYLDHLKTLAPKLKAAFDAGQTIRCDDYTLTYPAPVGAVNFRFCRKAVDLRVAAGEQIGTAGGSSGQRVYDFGLFDRRAPAGRVANPARWRFGRAHFPHVVCGVEYFTAALRAQLEPFLGGNPSYEGPRTIEPRCGSVLQDLPGTAQGVWVPPGIDIIGHEPPLLALVHDNVDPRVPVFSVGDRLQDLGIPHGKYTFTPRSDGRVNRDFPDVRADGQVSCFETKEQQRFQKNVTTLLVTLPNETTLRIGPGPAGSCGAGPWPLTKFVEFQR